MAGHYALSKWRMSPWTITNLVIHWLFFSKWRMSPWTQCAGSTRRSLRLLIWLSMNTDKLITMLDSYLELLQEQNAPDEQITEVKLMSSWRHTPFRNNHRVGGTQNIRSWRHTPFRNLELFAPNTTIGSWRHTPFRKRSFCFLTNSIRSWRHTPFRNVRLSAFLVVNCSWRHTPFRNIF